MMSHIDFKKHYHINDVIEGVCNRGEDYCLKLKNAKILLTGGTGFFGIWLLNVFKHLYEKNCFNGEIYLITRDPTSFANKNPDLVQNNFIKLIKGDVKTITLGGIKPDHLIHFASTSASETFHEIEQMKKIDTLYMGTKNILEQCGNSLKKVLFASSGAAYGHVESASKISEDTLSRLMSTNDKYALCMGKILSEFQINHYSKIHNYDYSIARCFTFAGEFMPLSLHYAFGNFINDAMNGRDIVMSGSGTELRSYMYIGDAVLWFLALLADPKNDTFNVGSDHAVSIRELANIVGAKGGCNVVAQLDTNHEGNFVRSKYVPCMDKSKEFYPYLECWTGLPQIVERMLPKIPH